MYPTIDENYVTYLVDKYEEIVRSCVSHFHPNLFTDEQMEIMIKEVRAATINAIYETLRVISKNE